MKFITHREEQEVHYTKEQQQKFDYQGSTKLQPGQKLFQYDMEKGELSEVKLEAEKTFDMATGDKTKHSKINAQNTCIYVEAINKKNAMRKVLKKFGFHVTKSGKVLTDIETKHVSPEEFESITGGNKQEKENILQMTPQPPAEEKPLEIDPRQKHFEDDGAYAD